MLEAFGKDSERERLNTGELHARANDLTGSAGVPSGIRTRVLALKGPRPGPWTMGTHEVGSPSCDGDLQFYHAMFNGPVDDEKSATDSRR